MISLIVAFDENRLIGDGNLIPWHYSEDLRYFKKITTGHTVVMGLNTFKSILGYSGGKPLPNRKTIVIANPAEYSFAHDDVTVTDRLFGTLADQMDEHLFIVGGASIYNQTHHLAERLYITHIDKSFKGDCYFPEIDLTQYQLESEQVSETHPELRFCVYTKQVIE